MTLKDKLMEKSKITRNNRLNMETSEDFPEELDNFVKSLKRKKKKKIKKEKSVKKTTNPSDQEYTYYDMLERLAGKIKEGNPNYGSEKKKIIIPQIQIARKGQVYLWINISKIVSVLQRNIGHFVSFFLAETGFKGSLDSQMQLNIKGRIDTMTTQSLVKLYITRYVICEQCKSLDTLLMKDSMTRLIMVSCNNCHAERSTSHISKGFNAKTREDRRKDRKR